MIERQYARIRHGATEASKAGRELAVVDAVGSVAGSMNDPASLAQQYIELRDAIAALEFSANDIRDRLKSMLLGEATEPPPGGWVYGPVTVQYVKPSERTSISRRKLVQNGVSLEQIASSMDVTKMPPTIRVVKTAE